MENRAVHEADATAQKAAEAAQAAQEADNCIMQNLRECRQALLEGLETVRSALTDEDDIKDIDARIAKMQAMIADLEAE